MGLRFRKTVKLCKGVKLNVSKSGLSVTVGKKGASVNIGKNGVYGNLGIPGTGISYRQKLLDMPDKLKEEAVESELIDIVSMSCDVLNETEVQKEWNRLEKTSSRKEEQLELKKLVLSSLLNKENLNEVMEDFVASIQLPFEISINYDFYKEQHCLYVDMDLPEIEDIPKECFTQQDGKMKKKKKTQTQIKEDYIQIVFGLAVFVCSYFFNMSFEIERILISSYTQRRNSEGDLKDEYIYSIKFSRNVFEETDLTKVDPYEFCMNFENRCHILSNKTMKEIVPFD